MGKLSAELFKIALDDKDETALSIMEDVKRRRKKHQKLAEAIRRNVSDIIERRQCARKEV